MHSLLLITHIVALSLSMLAIASLTAASLLGKASPAWQLLAAATVTTVGGLAGAGLLLSRPLGPDCLALTGYLALYAGLHAFVSRRQTRLAAQPSLNQT